MKIEKCVKESFVVIGKAGSTLDGDGFIQRLWADANSHFEEILHLARPCLKNKSCTKLERAIS